MNKLRKLLALAVNSVAERCIAYSIATNIAPITDTESADDYKLLAPYGDTDYWIEDPMTGTFKKLTQRFTPPQAQQIVAAFNAWREKQGKNFIGMPIYRGHPDADPVRWPDDRRYGHLMDVQKRDDGLYAKPAWNDLGLDNKKNHYLPYPSIAWLYDMAATARTGIIEPDEIQSVGLTNQPRIKNVPVWTNAEAAAASAQSQFAVNNPTQPAGGNQHSNKLNMKKLLTSLLGLPEDAKDEDITAAHTKAMACNAAPVEVPIGDKKIKIVIAGANRDEAATAVTELATNVATAATELQTARTTATNAETEAKKFRGLAINGHLDRGIDKGLITAAERSDWQAKFEKDYDGTLVEFNKKKTALNTEKLDPLKPTDGPDLSTPRGRSLAFNARVDEIQQEARKSGREISIDDAINRMRATPADAALLKAMEPTPASK
jgi:type I restriction-modification system DNA methylase subunit